MLVVGVTMLVSLIGSAVAIAIVTVFHHFGVRARLSDRNALARRRRSGQFCAPIETLTACGHCTMALLASAGHLTLRVASRRRCPQSLNQLSKASVFVIALSHHRVANRT